MRRLLIAVLVLAAVAVLAGQIAGPLLSLDETGRWLVYAVIGAPTVAAGIAFLIAGIPPERVNVDQRRPAARSGRTQP